MKYIRPIIEYIRIPLKIQPLEISLVLILRLLVSLIPSVLVIATANFLDSAKFAVNSKVYVDVINSLFVLIALIGLNWLIAALMNLLSIRVKIKTSQHMRLETLKKIKNLKYYLMEDEKILGLIERVGIDPSEQILKGFNNVLNILQYVVVILGLVSILIVKVWWITFAILAIAIPLIKLSLKHGVTDYEAFVETSQYRRKCHYLRSIMVTREAALERNLFDYNGMINNMWHNDFENARKIEYKVDRSIFIKSKVASISTTLVVFFIALFLLQPLSNGEITSGIYVSLVIASLNLLKKMSWEFSKEMQEYAKNKAYMLEFDQVLLLEERNEERFNVKGVQQKRTFMTIEFKNVTFSYPNSSCLILNKLTYTFLPNKRYAIVGRNGVGKTTITKLLLGLYDDYEGDILIDGRELRTYLPEELQSFFGVVFQDFARYELSIRENIMLDRSAYKELDEIIDEVEINREKLKDGLDTKLGKIYKNGVDLSAGQWQKIAIARSKVFQPPVFILDEPTASLDPIAEKKIYDMFSASCNNCTSIVITHRLGSAKKADDILVLNDGQIIENGRHDELMKLKGLYSEMYNSQRSWYNEG